jgi:hypothetical protein
MLYFMKGTTLVYAGQEYCCDHTPSLFEKDVFIRDSKLDISAFLRHIYELKKSVLSNEDYFMCRADDENDIAVLERDDNHTYKLGVFSLKGKSAKIKVKIADGIYKNHIDDSDVTVKNGVLPCDGNPIVITCNSGVPDQI